MNLSMIAAKMIRCYAPVLSDANCKDIEDAGGGAKSIAAHILVEGPPYSEHEVKLLLKAAQADKAFDQADVCEDSAIDAYAKYIHNYDYTYKDEAKKVDPTIDTSIPHNGPMAQDIQKVVPDAVVKDKSGYLTVDPGRLTLNLAGVVADLAREVKELKNGA